VMPSDHVARLARYVHYRLLGLIFLSYVAARRLSSGRAVDALRTCWERIAAGCRLAAFGPARLFAF
jgi:hypothetical protein